MERIYSISIAPSQRTRTYRFSLSKKSILYFLSAAFILSGISGWLLGDYLWMKWQKKGVKELRMESLAQREQLSVLQDQTKNLQLLLTDWKGIQQGVQASLPSQNRSSFTGHLAIKELERGLASLRSELERLFASGPVSMPIKGRITSGVGTRLSPWTGKPEFHSGLDLPNPVGTPVYAPADGLVESVSVSNGNGQMVVLNHGQGITTQYLHLSKANVKKGDRVHKGQQIAESGNTGKTTSPHLHYEVRVNS